MEHQGKQMQYISRLRLQPFKAICNDFRGLFLAPQQGIPDMDGLKLRLTPAVFQASLFIIPILSYSQHSTQSIRP